MLFYIIANWWIESKCANEANTHKENHSTTKGVIQLHYPKNLIYSIPENVRQVERILSWKNIYLNKIPN